MDEYRLVSAFFVYRPEASSLDNLAECRASIIFVPGEADLLGQSDAPVPAWGAFIL